MWRLQDGSADPLPLSYSNSVHQKLTHGDCCCNLRAMSLCHYDRMVPRDKGVSKGADGSNHRPPYGGVGWVGGWETPHKSWGARA